MLHRRICVSEENTSGPSISTHHVSHSENPVTKTAKANGEHQAWLDDILECEESLVDDYVENYLEVILLSLTRKMWTKP